MTDSAPEILQRNGSRSLLTGLYRHSPGRATLAAGLACTNPLLSGINILLLLPILDAIGLSSGQAGQKVQGILSVANPVGLSMSAGGLLTIFAVAMIACAGLQLAESVVQNRLYLGFVLAQQKAVNTGLSRADWTFFLSMRPQDIAHALSVESDRVLKGLRALLALISSVAMIVIYSAMSAWISWRVTVAAAGIGLLVIPIVIPWVKKSRGSGSRLTNSTRLFYRQILDHLAGIKESRSMNAQDQHTKAFNTIAKSISAARMDLETAKAMGRFLFSSAIALAISLVIYIAITFASVASGDLIVLVAIFSRLTPRLLSAQTNYQDFANSLPAWDSVQTLKQEFSSFEEIDEQLSVSAPGPTFTNVLHLSDVSFRYGAEIRPALDRINLVIPSGSITAIVGKSGSGKSTLANLLLGLLRPESGRITADDCDILDDIRAWRQQVGYVPQESFLLNATLRENLQWGSPNATDEDMRRALQKASALDVLESVPDGLDSPVGERGDQLSGGQRQRIAIARALLRNPSILILDEATAALDERNQLRILGTLRELKKRMTIVMITHSLASLAIADNVIHMADGHILSDDSEHTPPFVAA